MSDLLTGPTWVGVRCECGAVTPVISAVPGDHVWRSPRMPRLPRFTRRQQEEASRVLAAGIDCEECHAALEAADLVWTDRPIDAAFYRFLSADNTPQGKGEAR